MRRLLSPPDKRPLWDLHLGVVSSKLDITGMCPPFSTLPRPKNNATLRAPYTHSTNPSPDWHWPASWASKWPPSWPYLTGEMGKEIDLPALVWLYVDGMSVDGDCNISQMMEVAALALDGRNPGFVRPDSLLVVLLLANREDCSTKTPSRWDPDLWDVYHYSGDACYEPPADLLHPVERYVEIFPTLHPMGQTLVAALGWDAKPTWAMAGSLKVARGSPDCQGQVLPAPRLSELVRKLNGLEDPRTEALFIDACPLLDQNLEGLYPLADRILALVER